MTALLVVVLGGITFHRMMQFLIFVLIFHTASLGKQIADSIA